MGQEPNYTHDPAESKNLDYFTITVADALNPQAKINRLIIAVDVAPDGEKYVLTFGNGIKKVGINGGLVDFIPNTSNRLSNAMDFAINSDGKFFVATNESGRRFIRVYSPAGAYLSNETLGDGNYGSGPNRFRGPVGLTFDKDDNLYVADHYIGDENPSIPSFIKIYSKDSGGNYKNNLESEFHSVNGTLLNFPYRIAINSKRQVYISELGQDNVAKVKIINLDSNFNPTGLIEGPSVNLGAPGSLIIDKFDYVFVADFGNDIDLPRLLAATSDIDEFYAVFEIIKEGIKNDVFKVNVYNPDNSFYTIISSGIDFPIGFAIDECGTLYVDNAIFDGEIDEIFIPFLGWTEVPDFELDFDLEVYQRSAGYDTEAPVLVECPEDIEEELTNGAFVLDDYRALSKFSDNCDDSLDLVQAPPAGTSITENTVVTIVATDDSGNESEECTFTVKVKESTDTTEPVFTYCENQSFSASADDCGAIVNYTLPEASDDSGEDPEITLVSGPAPGAFVLVGEVQTVIYRATDQAGNFEECTFTITVTDDEDPTITCPGNIVETVAPGETGKVVNYNLPEFNDNCPGATIDLITGLSSGSEFPLGETLVTFEVTDASDNTFTCSFKVTITEDVDEEDPQIICPPTISTLTESGQCGAVVDYEFATATDNSGTVTVNKLNGPDPGEFFPVGSTEIVFEARDASDNIVTCTLTVTVSDEEPPVFTSCLSNEVQQIFEVNGEYVVPDFRTKVEAVDNCSSNSEISYTQSIAPGTRITEGTFIHIFAYDEYDNESVSCSFEVELVASPEAAFEDCPEDMNINNDSGVCGAEVSFSTPLAFEGDTALQINQISGPASGSVFPVGMTIVSFEAVDSNGYAIQCSFEVTVNDVELPVMECSDDLYFTVASEDETKIVHFSTLPATDSCSASVVQTEGLSSGSEFPVGTHTISFKATDPSGNESSCSFEIEITVSEEPPALELQCPEDQQIDLEERCDFVLPDYKDLITATAGATITQSPAAGTLITENTEIVFTAELNGETDTCSFEVQLINQAELVIYCIQDHTVEADPDGSFIIPDYRNQVNTTGNCGALDVVQTPAQGTLVNENTLITLTATDESGNVDDCSFTIKLNAEEPDPLSITCPEDQTLELDDNCELEIPDFTALAAASKPDAVITQSPPKGTVVTGNTTVTLTATLGTETVSCSFELIVQVNDTVDPTASCVSKFTLYLNEEGYGLLSADILDNGSYDNCGSIEMSLSQTRFDNSDAGDNTVILTVTDASGNSDTCETTVTVVPYEEGRGVNCGDKVAILDKNGEFTLVLQYTGNPENIDYEVSKDFFTCDDLGEQVITVNYWGEYTGSCKMNVTVIDDIDPVADCIREVDLKLNASGTARLAAEDLNLNSYDNCEIAEYSLSKTNFTTADVGTQQVTFTATDASGNTGTCIVTVNILPNEDVEPVECVDLHVIQIGANGSTALNPRDLFTGGSGTAQFTVSKDTFSCMDLGENTVILNYSTPTEEGSCEITIIVEDPEDRCEIPTEPAGDYVILYPNPSVGLVRLQPSPQLIIERIEVFDMRGRFLFEKIYPQNENTFYDYRLDLRAHQSGVYSLLIHTNGRQFLKRAIIKN